MKQAIKKNSVKPEKKTDVISYTFNGMSIRRFNLIEPGIDITTGFDTQNLKVGTNIDFAFNMEQNGFQVIFSLGYQYDLKGSLISLLELVVLSDFVIKDMKNVVEIRNEAVHIPDELLINLVRITYSSIRGIVFAKTQGSYLNKFILPLIDPGALIRKKLDSYRTGATKE